jgi:hypothetical protein
MRRASFSRGLLRPRALALERRGAFSAARYSSRNVPGVIVTVPIVESRLNTLGS